MAKRTTAIGGESPTNDAQETITEGAPYSVLMTIEGTCPLLFHRWSNEAVAAKAAAAKNSKAKKSDNIESYVYRNEDGELCLPGSYLIGAIVEAAKYRQDPRSPRKAARDLYRASVVSLTEFASLGVKDWDYLDQRRVLVMRSAITRVRPAMLAGWRAEFEISVLQPDYVSHADLLDVATNAGRFVGVGDFRPTYGRFSIPKFEVLAG
jgi:hypothetical protein